MEKRIGLVGLVVHVVLEIVILAVVFFFGLMFWQAIKSDRFRKRCAQNQQFLDNFIRSLEDESPFSIRTAPLKPLQGDWAFNMLILTNSTSSALSMLRNTSFVACALAIVVSYFLGVWYFAGNVAFFAAIALIAPSNAGQNNALRDLLAMSQVMYCWERDDRDGYDSFLQEAPGLAKLSVSLRRHAGSVPGGSVSLLSAIFGTRLSGADRDAALAYYRAALVLTTLQDREADRYNRLLMVHMNSVQVDRESSQIMLDASRRLSKCGRELIRRHALLAPVPDIDLVAADYALWTGVYYEYSGWADAQHDVFVALSQGRTPVASRVQFLMASSEKARAKAEAATKRLLRAIGLKASEVHSLMADAQKGLSTSDWEPEPD